MLLRAYIHLVQILVELLVRLELVRLCVCLVVDFAKSESSLLDLLVEGDRLLLKF